MPAHHKAASAVAGSITDADRGGFTAVASTGSIDRDGEVIQPGCFVPLPESVVVHADHVPSVSNVVARARPYYDTSGRLMIEGTWGSGADVQSVRQKVLDGLIDSTSIVFMGHRWDTIEGVRTCTAGELLAVDLVSIPSNRDARILAARSLRTPRPVTTEEARFQALQALMEIELATAKAALAHSHDTPLRSASADVRRFLRSL